MEKKESRQGKRGTVRAHHYRVVKTQAQKGITNRARRNRDRSKHRQKI